jgi:hypothetical protein
MTDKSKQIQTHLEFQQQPRRSRSNTNNSSLLSPTPHSTSSILINSSTRLRTASKVVTLDEGDCEESKTIELRPFKKNKSSTAVIEEESQPSQPAQPKKRGTDELYPVLLQEIEEPGSPRTCLLARSISKQYHVVQSYQSRHNAQQQKQTVQKEVKKGFFQRIKDSIFS